MTRTRSVAVVLSAASVMLSTTACFGGSSDDRTPSPSPPPTQTSQDSAQATSPLVWADGTGVQATVDAVPSRPALEGDDFVVVGETPVAEQDEERVIPMALMPDGSLVVAEIPPDQYDGGQWLLEPSLVGRWDGDMFSAFPDSTAVFADEHPRQASGASSDGATTVWTETTSTDLFQSSWRVFSHDATGTVHLVGRAEQINAAGLPIIDGDPAPQVHAGRAFWATSYPIVASPTSDARDWTMAVVSAPVDGSGELVVEAVDANYPAATAGVMYTVRPTPGEAFTPGHYGVVSSLEGGEAYEFVRTAPGWAGYIASIAAGGEHLAVVLISDTGDAQLAVISVSDHDALFVPLDSAQTQVAVCDDRIVFTSADYSGTGSEPVIVLTPSARTLSTAQVEGNYGPVGCAGDFVTWSVIGSEPGAQAQGVVTEWPR